MVRDDSITLLSDWLPETQRWKLIGCVWMDLISQVKTWVEILLAARESALKSLWLLDNQRWNLIGCQRSCEEISLAHEDSFFEWIPLPFKRLDVGIALRGQGLGNLIFWGGLRRSYDARSWNDKRGIYITIFVQLHFQIFSLHNWSDVFKYVKISQYEPRFLSALRSVQLAERATLTRFGSRTFLLNSVLW